MSHHRRKRPRKQPRSMMNSPDRLYKRPRVKRPINQDIWDQEYVKR